MKKTQIAFTRKEGGFIDQLLVVEFHHAESINSIEKVMQAFSGAITEWVENTEDGLEAWEQSTEDLNIGDLISEDTQSLNPFLQKYGILKWQTIYQLHEKEEVSYDRVLADPSLETA